MAKVKFDREVIAARAARNGFNGRHANKPGMDPANRVDKVIPSGYQGRNPKARMTDAQSNSEGRFSEWNMSMYFWTDARWSHDTIRGI